MDAKLIEKLDRRRFTNTLWSTIGAALFFPELVYADFIHPAVKFVSFAGFFLMIIFGIGLFLNESKIRSTPELKAALNNEMVRMHNRKSMMWAAGTALVTSLVMDFLASRLFPEITVHMVCMTVYFTTCMVGMISRLIYMRK